jgi:chaperonin cofactor prefoldin
VHRARLNARRAELTLEELSALSSDVPVYKQVGKAYFMAPMQQLKEELKEDIAARQDEAKRCVQQKDHADKAIAAAENELRELIKSHPEALRMLTAASG